jgi:hypothetical protein
MTNRTDSGTLLGYGRSIAAAIGTDDDALLDLVEDLMRTETGGTLDALSSADFERFARQSMTDILAWEIAGAVDGITLARYCDIMGLAHPEALDTVGATFAIDL